MKLSYIVTVYNTENMIARCMKSLLEQNLEEDEYEILLVDNGSTDNSGSVCDEYAAKYNNVRALHLENLGAGASRNSGIKAAKGEYIWYIDSDDLIEPNVTRDLLYKAIEQSLDVISFDLQLAWEDENLNVLRTEPYIITNKSGKDVMDGEEYSLNVGMPSAQWCSLYRRQFLLDNNLWFIEKITYEDQEYTPRAYYLAKRASHVNVIVYNYIQRPGSITKNIDNRERRANDYLTVCDSLYRFVKKNLIKGTPIYAYMMGRISFDFAQALRFCKPKDAILNDISKKDYYPLYIDKSYPMKTKIKYALINTSLSLYLTLHELLKR